MDRSALTARIQRWLTSGFYLGANNLVTPLFALASSVVMTRLLTTEAYGTYALYLSVILLLDFTSLSGLGTAVIHATSKGLPGTLRKATSARLKSSMVGSAILLVIAAYRATDGLGVDTGLFIACAFAFPFYFPYTNFLYQLVGTQEFRRLVEYQTIHLAMAYLPVIAVAALTRDYRAVLVAHLVATPIARFVFYRRVVADIPTEAPVEPGYLRYGVNVTAMGMLGALEIHLDRIFLGTVFSPAVLATFHVGKNIGYQGRNVWNIAYHYVFSSLSRRPKDSGFPRALFAVLGIYLGALGALYLVTPWAVALLYEPEYAESVVTARWFFTAAALGGPAAVLDTYFLSVSWMWAVWTGRIARTLVYVASLFMLVARFEIDGFYYAATASNAIHSLLGAVLMFAGSRMTRTRKTNEDDEGDDRVPPGIEG